MISFRRRLLAPLAVLCMLALGPGCTTNPVTGKSEFTPLMGPAEEAAIGAEEHPKLVAAFGGVYDERAALTHYVNTLGLTLKRASETPGAAFTFTIVNSDVVNAFALPGGYVYVSRGLMALANSEAELAGVIARGRPARRALSLPRRLRPRGDAALPGAVERREPARRADRRQAGDRARGQPVLEPPAHQ